MGIFIFSSAQKYLQRKHQIKFNNIKLSF